MPEEVRVLIDVAIYGKLSRLLGGKFVATEKITLPASARVKDLYALIGIEPEETTYVFINAVLSDMPGLNVALEDDLHDGDHIGIFSQGYVWPYQYRDGSVYSERLQAALAERDALHHHLTRK